MQVVAIMIIRNEEACLPRCLEHLAEQGLQAAVIDNGSTDHTPSILESFSPRTVIRVEHAPFRGVFEWAALLRQAAAMQGGIKADWFHLNSPDEICQSNRKGERLVEAIARVEAEGFNTINYDEFVFLPAEPNLSCEGKAFDRLLRHYYYYAPTPLRQMRTWKNIPGISNISDAGHRLQGPDLRIYPENFVLRHYLALNEAQFRRKYANRVYPADELERGWHFNRVNIDTNRFRLPRPEELKTLTRDDPSALDRSDPWQQHFWERPARPSPFARATAFLKNLKPRMPRT